MRACLNNPSKLKKNRSDVQTEIRAFLMGRKNLKTFLINPFSATKNNKLHKIVARKPSPKRRQRSLHAREHYIKPK